MAATYLLGREATAYYSPTAFDGVTVNVTWLAAATVVPNIMDLALEIDSEFVDATTRGEASQGFASEIPVLRNGRITFDIRWYPSDTTTAAMVAAWNASTEIAMAFMELPYATAGDVSGLRANFSVSLSKTENLRDIQKAAVTLTISSFPEWITV